MDSVNTNIKRLSVVIFAIMAFLNLEAQSKSKVEKIRQDCIAARQEFIEADKRMEKRFKDAYGYIILPNVGKGGLGVGGAAGRGVAYENGQEIGLAKMTQVTVGFQAGGQAYREVIFFQDEEAMNKFKKGKFELSAQASAVAVTEGASENVEFSDGLMIFTMQKGGLMFEATVGGQKLSFSPF